MNQLSNAFSLLELDVSDDEDQKRIAVANNGVTSKRKKGKGRKSSENSGDTSLSIDENNSDEALKMTSEEYKLPLVWIDLEMTGLNVEVDRILEIACIITDGNLTKSIEGPDLVIHQTKECLDNMGEWCQSHHGESGLTKRVLQSKLTEEEAEERVVQFVKRHVGIRTPLLAGNSVYVDLLFLKSCKHESCVSTAKYPMENVHVLLGLGEVEDVKNVLSVVFKSLPSNFMEFIKWIAEVRRQEDSGQSLSQEEKGRLVVKEEVLKQVHELGLYKHVTDFLSSESSCCQGMESLSSKESLPVIAANICCQGAGLMEGNCRSSVAFSCSETGVKCRKANGDNSITVIFGKVVNGNDEQQVDVLVPSFQKEANCSGSCPSSYKVLYPASNDVLTALLLTLPPETWSGIKNEKFMQEIHSLVSTENLLTLLQEEVTETSDGEEVWSWRSI